MRRIDELCHDLAIPRLATHGGDAAGGRSAGQPQARAAADAPDGNCSAGPEASPEQASAGTPDLPYLLRALVIELPNRVWCADITYIPIGHGFLYLVAIMDWASPGGARLAAVQPGGDPGVGLASVGVAFEVEASCLSECHSRSMITLSIQRPRPSSEMRILQARIAAAVYGAYAPRPVAEPFPSGTPRANEGSRLKLAVVRRNRAGQSYPRCPPILVDGFLNSRG
jgi:hypothetical protein